MGHIQTHAWHTLLDIPTPPPQRKSLLVLISRSFLALEHIWEISIILESKQVYSISPFCVAGACAEAPPPRLTPPPCNWPPAPPASTSGSGSATWPPPPSVPPPSHSHPRWDEREAARALSQLASSPVQGGSLGAQTAPPPCT